MLDYECENCLGMPEYGCYCKAMGSPCAGGPTEDYQRVDCPICDGSGRITSAGWDGPDSRDNGPCSACDGRGFNWVEKLPVTLEDLSGEVGLEYRG